MLDLDSFMHAQKVLEVYLNNLYKFLLELLKYLQNSCRITLKIFSSTYRKKQNFIYNSTPKSIKNVNLSNKLYLKIIHKAKI